MDFSGPNDEPWQTVITATKSGIFEILRERDALLNIGQNEIDLLGSGAEKMMKSKIGWLRQSKTAMKAHWRETWYAAYREFLKLLDPLPQDRVPRERIEITLREKGIAHVRHSDVTRLLVHEINADARRTLGEGEADVPRIIGIPSDHKPENPHYVLLNTDFLMTENPALQHALRSLDN